MSEIKKGKPEGKPKPELLYKLKIRVDEKEVGLKPFILNTLGHVCDALISQLKEPVYPSQKEEIEILIQPKNSAPEQVKLNVNSISIEINDYVQGMLWNTIAGFISTLKNIAESHEDLLTKSVAIKYERK